MTSGDISRVDKNCDVHHDSKPPDIDGNQAEMTDSDQQAHPGVSESRSDSDPSEKGCEANTNQQSVLILDPHQQTLCKYRWGKTIVTRGKTIAFQPSYDRNSLIALSWNAEHCAYLSGDVPVMCGGHVGNLIIAGQRYLVEEFTVKFYSFEIDLYVREDLIEDEVAANPILALSDDDDDNLLTPHHQLDLQDIDLYRDLSDSAATLRKMSDKENQNGVDDAQNIKLSTKYEDLVRHQILGKDDLDLEIEERCSVLSVSFSASESGHGDVVTGKHTTHSQYDGSKNNSFRSDGSEKHNLATLSDLPVSVPNGDVEYSQRPRPSSRSSRHSNSPRQISQASSHENLSHTSANHTEKCDTDAYHYRSMTPDNAHSYSHSRAEHCDSRENSTHSASFNRELGQPLSTSSNRGSQERLYEERVPSRSGESRSSTSTRSHGSTSHSQQHQSVGSSSMSQSHGSSTSSSHSSSHPRSMTSEQELSQYFDQNSQKGLSHHSHQTPEDARNSRQNAHHPDEDRRTPVYNPHGLPDTGHDNHQSSAYGNNDHSSHVRQSPTRFRDNDASHYNHEHRPTSTHSLPVIPTTPPRDPATYPNYQSHSLTPDTYSRIHSSTSGPPPIRTPLITTRTAPIPGNHSSQSSSRTVTPVSAGEGGAREDRSWWQRNEDTSRYKQDEFKRLLTNKENEVEELRRKLDDLREVNRSLHQEINQSVKRTDPRSPHESGETSERYNHLLSEKEILATEVVRLRDEVDALRQNPKLEGLEHYSPNSPGILQRRIDDQESQIQDLQEANEASVMKLRDAESRLHALEQDNAHLRASLTRSEGLTEENHMLNEQISRLVDEKRHIEVSSDQHLRIETQQLHDDIRAIRERNYQLNEENVRQDEQIQELRRRFSKETSERGSARRELDYDSHRRSAKYQNEVIASSASTNGAMDTQVWELDKIGRGCCYNYEQTSSLPHTGNQTRELSRRRSDSESSDSTAALMSGYTSTRISDATSIATESSITINRDTSLVDDIIDTDDLDGLSDAGTDVLLAQPAKFTPSVVNQQRNRISSRPSSLASEVDDYKVDSRINRSRSANSKDKAVEQRFSERSHQYTQSTAAHDRAVSHTDVTSPRRGGAETRSHSPGAGLRTVITKPITTQHNKGTLRSTLSKSLTSLTQGMHPFVPRSPNDLCIDDIVKFSRQGGKISTGSVHYIGHLPGRNDIYLGVSLDKEDGKHDGVFEGIRYFKCKSNKGVFVAFNKVIMAWKMS